MDKHEIAPDVIDSVPSQEVKLKYGDLAVNKGNVLTPTQVQNPPTHISWPTEQGAFYTLLMTDPDAPRRSDPKFREWHHWLVVNIPGCDVSKGMTAAEYIGSGPPKGTGLHRYIFLVYKQQGQITYSDPIRKMSAEGRGGCKARDLAAKYNLGSPVACNLYQAEYDDYVPKLYKKLK
ncbi:protein D3 isoform X2 [Nematostella vectensis]|uniref:protein D3 isoform X2 n=1 Tax=Nematostella vectensis TaxID=45351 RepID=UPI00139046C8|nr:protein D3 isoform X2 [Nematostella vectensis]